MTFDNVLKGHFVIVRDFLCFIIRTNIMVQIVSPNNLYFRTQSIYLPHSSKLLKLTISASSHVHSMQNVYEFSSWNVRYTQGRRTRYLVQLICIAICVYKIQISRMCPDEISLRNELKVILVTFNDTKR